MKTSDDWLPHFRRAKSLETLELMVKRALEECQSASEKFQVYKAEELREQELERMNAPERIRRL
ncbi:hypothetical protein [Gallaecimonas xiamenensis]|uniref:Uncharacterized protein n=1 Tax=Gallaecimonas xiamenensis 3-C-1 TaxID=745411 RepID=K2JJ89_9GAMM|nr:hypothetical protein [Gallaecimonas xiamenensis]EKE75358.1 hypothetical protein B3C1_06769 [Gallaecimonas xiamenensis 3-C-1]